jgi:hypothetical protein
MSPPKTRNGKQKNDSISTPNAKRPASELSPSPEQPYDQKLDMLMNLVKTNHVQLYEMMNNNCEAMNKNCEAMKKNYEEIKGIVGEIDVKLTREVSTLKEDLGKVSETGEMNSKSIDILRRKMNEIDQEKLKLHMEIVGLPENIPENEKNLRETVICTIKRFVEDFDATTIEYVYSVTLITSKKIVVVVFKNSQAKSHVMRTKRTATNEQKIFFNDRLTSINRALFQKARSAVGIIGARSASVIRGNVSILKADNTRLKIRWFDDIPDNNTN